MTTLVAFLRGVNVGGINIKMSDLKASFEELGFTGVKTILASGNVRFTTSDRNSRALKKKIESALSDRFGYEAWVIVLDVPSVERIIEAYPFGQDDGAKQSWVMLLADPNVLDDLMSITKDIDPDVERLKPGQGVLYWEVTKGETLHSRFGKHSSKARFKALVTTRNLRTLRKVLD